MNTSVKSARDEYYFFWNKIVRGENFSLVRYGDGEKRIMLCEETKAQEGWYSPPEHTALGEDLRKYLTMDRPDYYCAISCPCCDMDSYLWYLENLHTKNITTSNIWVNANYRIFLENFMQLKRDAITITNFRAKNKKIGSLNVLGQYFIDDDCVGFWDKYHDSFVENIIEKTKDIHDTLFVISAGPLSGIIIAKLYNSNPNNCYIDFGSSLDEILYGHTTRPYMLPGSPESIKACWMPQNGNPKFDIDVILTSYKRPERLRQQLDSIKNQSIKPGHIFLYQDGIDDEYKIILDKSLISEFDNVRCEECNKGVWGRFAYAAEISEAKYICVFDDDTIPGRRWLENCWVNMQEECGIYGTNGVVLSEEMSYPYANRDLRIGWHNPNDSREEVDFVGHSWFFEKTCLSYMLEYKKRLHMNEKYVGEDICLSAAALEHGIKTFVPRHPFSDYSLWGSVPLYGNKYGMDSGAISSDSRNFESMNLVLKRIRKTQIKFLFEREPDYYKKLSEKYSQPVEEKALAMNEKLVKKCKKSDNIYIYGAGKYSKLLYLLLTKKNIAIQNFIVSDLNNTRDKIIDSIEVKQYSEIFENITKKDLILIGVSDFYQQEIQEKLADTLADIYPEKGESIEPQIQYINLEYNS